MLAKEESGVVAEVVVVVVADRGGAASAGFPTELELNGAAVLETGDAE